MGMDSEAAIRDLELLMDQIDEPLKKTFKNVHQGYPVEAFTRFLRAREWNVPNAHKMLTDSLNWRLENQIDSILSVHYYVQSHIQINEYRDRVVLPSTTKTHGRHISKCVKVLDMTGLRLSALSQIKLLTIISNIDDLNYPEKTQTYYIVNAPYVFSACWKVVKPLLQERTRKKVQVLSGCGQEELLKIMDYNALPHFCRKQGSGSSKYSGEACVNCFSLEHPFHQQLYKYMKQQALLLEPVEPLKQRSFHVAFPKTEESVEEEIAQTIESELQKLRISKSGDGSGSSDD